MARCSFCGHMIEPGTGVMFIKNDGKIFNFCALKCRKNLMKLGRVPKEMPWTRSAAKDKQERKEAGSVKTAEEKKEE